MRDRQLMVRMTATLLFGLLVLSLLFLLTVQMAAHYFQGVAEGTVREAFAEGTGSEGGYDAVCRGTEPDVERTSPCDPIAIRAERSLRSVACSRGGFLQLLGKQWHCVARFNDGATLGIHVSLVPWRRQLELVLPFRERGDAARR